MQQVKRRLLCLSVILLMLLLGWIAWPTQTGAASPYGEILWLDLDGLMILFYLLFGYPRLLHALVVGKQIKREAQEPEITIIIPAYNEEKFIKRKVENLLDCYPRSKMNILVVDNESTDHTSKVAEKLPVRLLHSKRGKINALNKGIEKAATEIIVMTDADTLLNKDSLKNLISSLHGDIGAVGGLTKLKGKNVFYIKSKLNYIENDGKMRCEEGLLDTSISLDGKLIAFRKSLYTGFPGKTYLDDYELTIALRKKGYRCIVDDRAIVQEECPSNLSEEIKQIKNRMTLTIMVNLKNMNMLFDSTYFPYNVFIFLSRRFVPLISPFIAIYLWVKILLCSWVIGLLTVPIVISFLFIINKEYLLIQLYGIGLSWLDVLFCRVKVGCQWDKVE